MKRVDEVTGSREISATIEISAVRDAGQLADLRQDLVELHRSSRPGSPFEHPAWTQTWVGHFLPDGDLECVAVRDRAAGGALIGFAPLYRARYSAAGLNATCIRPIGTGRQQALTEVVQVLALPDRTQDVLRAVIQHLETLPDWNWVQLSLNPDQGWLVPQWLNDGASAVITHRNARPFVILDDLPSDVDALRGRLKRNVRESIRRCRNRSAKFGDMTFRSTSDATEVEPLIGTLVDLHRMRSHMAGRVKHRDIFGEGQQAFLTEAATELAKEGLARVHLAEHRRRPVAALLVLSDGGTDYISATGLNPDYWELSLNTMLIFNALEQAVAQNRSAVNLSTGPDIAKMRWSSTVRTYHDFAVVRTDRRSRWAYGAFNQLTLGLEYRHLLRRSSSASGD